MAEQHKLEVMGHKIEFDGITNRALRRVVRNRIRCGEFMFSYGDSHYNHTDHRENISENSGGSDWSQYGDWNQHTDHREGYSDHKEHVDYIKE